MALSIEQGPVGRLKRRIVALLEYVAAIMLACVMLLVVVDVVARYLFHKPIGASFELIEMTMQVLVYLCIAVAIASNDHIRVTLIDETLARVPRLSGWIERLSAALVALALFGTGVAEISFARGKAVEVSAVLGLPIAPVVWAIALTLILSAALAFYAAIANIVPGDDHNG